MDPVTIIVILVVVELATGGVSGAVGAAGRAAWEETAKGAKQWYAKRAKGMKKSAWGRARLRFESATAGGVAFVGRGVAAGAKAAGPGAKAGWRKRSGQWRGVASGARQRVAPREGRHCTWTTSHPRSPLRISCGAPVADGGALCGEHQRRIDGGTPAPGGGVIPAPPAAAWAQKPEHGVIPPQEPDPSGWRKPGDPPVDPRVVITDEKVHADDFTYATDPELRQLATGGNQAAARELIRRAAQGQQSPAQGGGDKNEGEQMSNGTGFVAEDRGAEPYVTAWDTEDANLETTIARLQALRDDMAAAAEANARHEVGGVEDVVGRVDAALEALTAASEAIESHRQELHAKWDSTIEQLRATGADSATELAGAH